MRKLVEKHGAKNKWATIAVEAGESFGHDRAACEERYLNFVNVKLDSFAFGGASKGGQVEAHILQNTGVPGNGFGMHYYP